MIYMAIIYGILTIVGGLMGYLKAGSQASLISGGISGLLILLSAWALMKGKPAGYYGVIAISALLLVFFGMRFMKSHAFMPAGLMIILSLVTLTGFLLKKSELMALTTSH